MITSTKVAQCALLIAGILTGPVHAEKRAEAESSKSWCDALRDKPGLIYESRENPWIQSIEVNGRFHYQAVHVDGKDVRDVSFNDSYDEYRRFRLGAEIEFLRFLKVDIDSNLVDDPRFRSAPSGKLEWGHQDFNKLTLEIDLDDALELEFFDKLELVYGRMKLPVGAELHQSSREILTIERSSLSDQIGSQDSRPTGAVLEMGKGDWDLNLGIFSTDDDASGLASWNAGLMYYLSLAWEPGDWSLIYDQVINDPSGNDFGAGRDWVSSLSAIYEGDAWGLMVNGAYGDNGGPEQGQVLARRQGEFYGAMVMPWYWLIEDRLQLVASCEWMKAEENQGIRLASRYVRGNHDNPAIDVDGGRGDQSQVYYLGLNYLICEENAKIMAGFSHTRLSARQGDLTANSWMVAFRTYF